MKQPRLRLLYLLGLTCSLLILLPWPFRAQVAPACDSITDTFAENFNTDEFKNTELSSVAKWPTGPITLNRLGAQA